MLVPTTSSHDFISVISVRSPSHSQIQGFRTRMVFVPCCRRQRQGSAHGRRPAVASGEKGGFTGPLTISTEMSEPAVDAYSPAGASPSTLDNNPAHPAPVTTATVGSRVSRKRPLDRDVGVHNNSIQNLHAPGSQHPLNATSDPQHSASPNMPGEASAP